MNRTFNLLHLREAQHLNGGVVFKPIVVKGDFSKLPRDYSNIYMTEDDYLSLINENPYEYFLTTEKKTSDIDTLAFLGLKANENEMPPSPSPIPWGDLIVSTFTIDFCDYYRTYTGFFMKKKQSTKIEVCPQDRYFLAKSFLTLDQISYVDLHENAFYKKYKEKKIHVPLAGLTRGSKRSFSSFHMKSRLAEIQEKYKDGVK